MVTIVATNDFHSSILSGVGSLASLLQWRSRGAIILDSGDFFAGSALYQFAGGGPASKLLGGLFDAIVPGNHDVTDLQELNLPDRFPAVVCANMTPSSSLSCKWVKSLLIRRDEFTIGIVGLIGEQAFYSIPHEERKGFDFVSPVCELLAEEASRLRRSGATTIVGISHSGFDSDVRLQEQYGLFDVLFSSHCHSPKYFWHDNLKNIFVLKAPEFGKGVTRIQLDVFGLGNTSVDWLAPDTRSELECQEEWPWLHQVLHDFEAWGREHVGEFSSGRSIGRMDLTLQIADVVSAEVMGSIVVLNCGAVRQGLPAVVNRAAFADSIPFDSTFVRCNLSDSLTKFMATLLNLGEEIVVRGESEENNSIVTTQYIAQRIGLPFSAIAPSISIRTAAKTLFGAITK